MQSFYCAAVFFWDWVGGCRMRTGGRPMRGWWVGEVGLLFHHALPHFPFFSLRWNFLRRRVHTSLHWITRLFLSASRPTRSAVPAPPAETATPLAEATAAAAGAAPGPTPAPLSLPPITRKRLLIWILGHLQARSFMWTHRMLSPRFKGSPRLLYTDTTFTENLAQSPTVSMSSTLTWTAVDKDKKKKLNKTQKSEIRESCIILTKTEN